MAKGGGKGASAKAAKAAHETEVKSKKEQQAEAAEAAKWADGAKGKPSKEDKAEKAAALKAAKAERERLLAEEEANIKVAKPKIAPAKSAKSSKPPASSTARAFPNETPEYSASNVDDILDTMDVLTMDTDDASLGNRAARTVDAHPERRFKAAFEAYKEKELPIARKEYPGLRHQQYQELLHKQFEKHPDNPFNKLVVSYDASKEDKVVALKMKNKEVEDRLKT